jgi:hypothetical protein
MYLFCIRPLPPGAPAQPTGAIDFAVFGARLSTGLSSGLAAVLIATQQVTAPLQPTKTSSERSPMIKKKVLDLEGHEDFLIDALPIQQEI